jgi:twitching motility protein PilT
VGGGRHATFEILGTSLRVKDAILNGEAEGKTFYDIMETGNAFGMVTFDQHLVSLFEQGMITQETAMAYSSHRGAVGRGIDMIKSARGEATTDIGKLEIDKAYTKMI